jgi:hypothetical protein
VWLSAELEPQSALPLVGRESAQVWALTQGDDDRFVAALDVDWKPSLLFFDRKTVVRVTPAWSGDKARLLFDVATVDERVVVCGLEGDVGGNPRDPSFAGHQVLVASFGYDGSERASMRLPGRTCRLFSEGEGVVLFHQNSDDPRSGLRLTRLDKELRESDRRSALDRIAFLFKLEAERVGQSFVVLRNELGAPALDFIQDDDIHSMKLDPQIERPTAIRAVGDRVVVFSYDLRDSGESGVRVDSFVAGR